MSYFALSMQRVGIWGLLIMTFGGYDTVNGNSFHRIFDAANSDIECTPKHLE
jgi:hypothetical protein